MERKERDKQAALFDRLAARGTLYDYAPDAFSELAALADPAAPALDIGCGDGALIRGLRAALVVGCDISPRCARLAARRGVRAVVADATAGLPFRDGSFATVYCIGVAHHAGPGRAEMFGEMDRVLRPGGVAVLAEPDARNPFVRWTQAPGSPIRVAPYDNEPALYPGEVLAPFEKLGYTCRCEAFDIEGEQVVRQTFPLWQRVLKAPFVLLLAWRYRNRPKKFLVCARKPPST